MWNTIKAYIVAILISGTLGILIGFTLGSSELDTHPEVPPLNQTYIKNNLSSITTCLDGIQWQIFYSSYGQVIDQFQAEQIGLCDPVNE